MSDDKNVKQIKEVVESILPGSRIILFGSRARENFDNESDYDILVVIKERYTVKEKRQYAGILINKLAEMEIDADVIVKTEDDINYYKDKIGSITREALLEGIQVL